MMKKIYLILCKSHPFKPCFHKTEKYNFPATRLHKNLENLELPSISYSRSNPLAGRIGGTSPGAVFISGTIPR